MTSASRSRLARAVPAVRWGSTAAVFVLVLGLLPTGVSAPLGAAHAPEGIPADVAPLPVVPATGCSYNNSLEILLAASPTGGLAPLTTEINLTFENIPTPFTYSIFLGDGGWDNGTISSTCVWGTPVTVLVNHTYTWAAMFPLYASYDSSSGGQQVSDAREIYIHAWDAAGPTPITISANLTTAPVPASIGYVATAAAGVPSGLTYSWGIGPANGTHWLNTSTFTGPFANVTVQVPGPVVGQVYVIYPNGSWYDILSLPNVTVTPLLIVPIVAVIQQGASPFPVTFYSNITNASGGSAFPTPTAVNWTFGDGGIGAGTIVHHLYWTNDSEFWQEYVTVTAYNAAGTVVGDNATSISLYNSSSQNATPPLSVTLIPWYPGGGAAPFTVNFSVSASGGGAAFQPYQLAICVFARTSAPPPTPASCAPVVNTSTWNGVSTEIGVNFTTAGQYTVVAYVHDQNASAPYAYAAANVTITPPGTLTLVASVAPNNGTAPLNVSVGARAYGGVGPYDLRVWWTNATLTTPVANVTLWNGAGWNTVVRLAAAGGYNVFVNVTDTQGASVQQFTSVGADQPAPAAPLVVTAAFAPLTIAGATSFSFSASVSGGVGPYVLVWSFGDGTSAPGSATASTPHTYSAPGSYSPSLTVTDRAGNVVTKTLGVAVAGQPSTVGLRAGTVPSWQVGVALAAVLGSTLAIALVVRWAARRREGLNWVRPFESPSDGPERPPSAP